MTVRMMYICVRCGKLLERREILYGRCPECGGRVKVYHGEAGHVRQV